jgi:hypothetical protein
MFVHLFAQDLSTELQMFVHLFAQNLWGLRIKICKTPEIMLTHDPLSKHLITLNALLLVFYSNN